RPPSRSRQLLRPMPDHSPRLLPRRRRSPHRHRPPRQRRPRLLHLHLSLSLSPRRRLRLQSSPILLRSPPRIHTVSAEVSVGSASPPSATPASLRGSSPPSCATASVSNSS